MRSFIKQGSVALILSNIGGFIALMFSTTFFTGMFFWLIGKRGRGKGGGTITSLAVSIVLVALYNKQFTISEIFLFIMLSFLVAIFCIQIAEQFMLEKWGARKRHNGDIVERDFNETSIDELHGMLITVLPIYFIKLEFWPFVILHGLALAAFRVFDVWKPWFIRKVEKGCDQMFGLDIILDDTAAGFMAMIVTIVGTVVIKSYL